jgi:hypothetical protein
MRVRILSGNRCNQASSNGGFFSGISSDGYKGYHLSEGKLISSSADNLDNLTVTLKCTLEKPTLALGSMSFFDYGYLAGNNE